MFLLLTMNIFHTFFSSVSIVDIEHINIANIIQLILKPSTGQTK